MRPIFIGDELTAAGYRLAGLEVRTPAGDEAQAAVREAVAEAPPLLLVGMSCLRRLPADELSALLGAVNPPVLPVADASGSVADLDLVDWIRSRIVA